MIYTYISSSENKRIVIYSYSYYDIRFSSDSPPLVCDIIIYSASRPRAQVPAETYHCWGSPLHADSQTNTRRLRSTTVHFSGPGVGPDHLRPACNYCSSAWHRLNSAYLFRVARMPTCERASSLPHCVPVLSAGHMRKSRVTVSSLAHFFSFEPVEQDLRAPVTGVCAQKQTNSSSPPPRAQIIRGNVATQSRLSF